MSEYVGFTQGQVNDLLNYIGVSKIGAWKGDKISFCCPIHGESNPSCGITLDFNSDDISHGQVFNCFSCGASGNLAWFTFLSLPDKFHNYGEAVRFLERRYGVNVDQPQHKAHRHILNRYGEIDERKDERVVLPKYTLAPYRCGSETYKYFFDRGFSREDLIEYQIGRDIERETVIIPVFWRDGELAGLLGRYISPNRPPNYRYEIYGKFQRSKLIYPLDKVEPDDGVIIVVEGMFDAILLRKWGYKNAVAVMGNSISEAQVDLIAGLCDTVILLFDCDVRGVNALTSAKKRLKSRVHVKTVTYPINHGKDPGEWGKSVTEDVLKTASMFGGKLTKI